MTSSHITQGYLGYFFKRKEIFDDFFHFGINYSVLNLSGANLYFVLERMISFSQI